MTKTAPVLLPAILLIGLLTTAKAGPARKHRAVPALPPLSAPTVTPPTAAGGVDPAAPFDGQDPAQAGLTLAPWGGGGVQDSTAPALADGGHSLLVTTVDNYQGAKIAFNTPVPLGDMSATRFLQVTLRFPKAPVRPRGAGRGGFGRRGRGGGGGNGNAPPDTQNDTAVVTTLHWVLSLADGRQAEVLRPLPDGALSGKDWISIGVPLSALKFSPATAPAAGAALQSLTIGADGYAQFSVGAIKVVSDSTPITAGAGRSQTVTAGSAVTLHGTGDGGPSELRYTWNFDTAGGGTAQAEGQTVTTQYYTGGKDYTVTLTVSDIDGIKAPATDTTVVHVH